MYLLPQNKGNQITRSGQAAQQMQLMEPDTHAVINAFAIEAVKGDGTLSADMSANRVKEFEKTGTPLTEDQYKQSEFYRPNIKYYRGITDKAAEELAKFDDGAQKRAEIIGDATTGQAIAGYGMAFAMGMGEPKNVATGLVTSLVLTPFAASIGGPANSIRRLMKMRQATGQMSGRVALGAIEGGVSAAIAEPSNQYSARILQQDYTMADSMWNVALSTAFGVGASGLGIGAKEVPKFVREKWERNGPRAADVIAHEMDTAVNQLAQGKQVDVGLVERSSVGEVAKKSIAEKAAAVEQYIKEREIKRIEDVPEVKPQLSASEYSDSLQKKYGAEVSLAERNDGSLYLSAIKVAKDERKKGIGTAVMEDISKYADESGKRVTLTPSTDFGATSVARLTKFYKRFGFVENKGKNKDYSISDTMIREPQGKSVRSVDEINSIATKIDTEHAAALQKHIVDDLNDLNDTAIDQRAVAELEAYEEQLALEKDMKALDEYNEYIKEVAAMKREGILSEADEAEMLDAINSIKESDVTKGYETAYLCLTRG